MEKRGEGPQAMPPKSPRSKHRYQSKKSMLAPMSLLAGLPFHSMGSSSNPNGGFQGFRFGFREKGFSLKLFANLVLLPK